MYKIVDDRGTGKSSRLMLLAKEHNGVFVCANPHAMAAKARAYGLTGFDIISYYDYVSNNYDYEKKCFIDELDVFISSQHGNLAGYTLTIND